MAMLGAKGSQPISKIVLGLVLGRFSTWVTCVVCKMIVRTLGRKHTRPESQF
jgi:hypothetical protein